MYNYPTPPFWGYPPPMVGQQQTPIEQAYIEKGMRLAEKIRNRDLREMERAKSLEKKFRDEEYKRVAATRARMLTSLEWFIIGVISYPFVGPMYQLALSHVQTVVK